MKSIVVLLFAVWLCAPAAAQTASPNGVQHQFIEAKVKDDELLKMAIGKPFSLPQLRVYDRQGRQVGNFVGFEAETFKKKLAKVLQSPTPIPGKPELSRELKVIVDGENKRLKELPSGDFTFVEYWADWCEPCHKQFKLLQEALDGHTNLAVIVLHVRADATKLPGMKVVHEE
jgi:thiol-disulfide isomerase/thioredoxin